MTFQRRAARYPPIVLALLVGGCVSRSTAGEEAWFHYRWWIPLGILVAGAAAIPLGLLVRKLAFSEGIVGGLSSRVGWTLLIAGPLAAFVFAPSFLFTSVTVTDNGFASRGGFFGMTAKKDVSFKGLRQIQIVEEATEGRYSRIIETLVFDRNSGEPERFPLNNDVCIEAAKEIVKRAAAQRILIVDRREKTPGTISRKGY
jgi:hypothetical protein